MTQTAQHTPGALKDCPFCGTAATQHNWYPDECMCMNEKCIMFSRVIKHEVWNKRAAAPETAAERDRLKSQCAKLTKALRKISNINTASCEKYVAIADGIATDALVENDEEHYSSEMSLVKATNAKLLAALKMIGNFNENTLSHRTCNVIEVAIAEAEGGAK